MDLLAKTDLSALIAELKPSKLFFLVDENTHEHCLPRVLADLQTDIALEILEIEPGEEMKTLETAAQLWSVLADFQADRKALMINVGGGVVCDLGGFIASTYKRGIPFVNIPTTLLAMCDASIGGKTGIDHHFLKNIVGTFAEPQQVFFISDFLNTLPFSELRSGFAEMLKHGLIADEKHWQQLSTIENLTVEAVVPHIPRSMEIKEAVTKADFMEKNVRKTLNFGHTIGHAAESMFLQQGRPVPHGEAVAMGMICEIRLSEYEKLIAPDTAQRIISVINRIYPKLDISKFADSALVELMRNDKKNTEQEISFSLLNGIGSCLFDYKVNEANIFSTLDFYKAM